MGEGMASETTMRVPCLDFSREDLKPGTPGWEVLRAQVREAFEQHGCFKAMCSPQVIATVQQDLLPAAKQLLHLPTETKAKNNTPANPHVYMSNLPEAPLVEIIRINGAHSVQVVRQFADLMWGRGNSHFCETMNLSAKHLMELEEMIRRMCFESLGVDKYLESHSLTLRHSLNIQRYKPPSESKKMEVALAPHNDMNFLTILVNDNVGGLEALAKDGNWLPLVPSPNALLVIVADSLTAWSNNRFKSLRHRVIMSGKEERISCGVFSIPKDESVVVAPEELVDEDHPRAFKPFMFKDFSRFGFTKENQTSKEPLKTFAGI